MTSELGSDWKSLFHTFDPIPFASASIGQVHHASLSPTQPLAVKVQFPNVAESISSDLQNISMLLHASRLLPRGLYLDKTLEVMQGELEEECDYLREAEKAREFRRLLKGDERFEVYSVYGERLSTKRVLTMQKMGGISVAAASRWGQDVRDHVSYSAFRSFSFAYKLV